MGKDSGESSRSLTRVYPEICLEGLRKSTETLCLDSQCSLPAGAMTDFPLNNNNYTKCMTHFYLQILLEVFFAPINFDTGTLQIQV